MDDFWRFAFSYWWLIFPIGAVVGGFARRWEFGARDRHKRRLEILQAKAALKAASHTPKHVATATDPKPITKPTPTQPQLEKLFAIHDGVTARWLEYELDVAKLIAYPSISDGRQPLTAAFLRAKKTADHLRPPSVKSHPSDADLAAYSNAVTDYEVAFDIAEREARRLRDSDFTSDERKRLATAQKLLAVAVDGAATPAERQVAYKRVRDELDGLIVVSDEAITILENKVALPLTASHATVPQPATDADASRPPAPAPGASAPAQTAPAQPAPAAPDAEARGTAP